MSGNPYTCSMRISTILLVCGFVLFLGASCTKKTVTTTVNNATVANTNTSVANVNANANVNAAAQTTSSSVDVTSSGFSPRTLAVKKGTTVTWTNNSGPRVYVAPDTHPTHIKYRGVWDDDGSGDIANGETYSFTFQTTGTFTFHNHLSSGRTGTITVTE